MLPPARIRGAAADRSGTRFGPERTLSPTARVAQSQIKAVRICNTSSGCTGLVTNTLAVETSLVLYAAGYRGSSFRRNVPVTWTVSSLAVVSPTTGISTTLTGNALGNVVVTATLIETPTVFNTAMLTVIAGALETLVIRDAPNGAGDVVTDSTRVAGTPWTLYAAGYDKHGNLIPNPMVAWTVVGGIGSIAPAFGSSTVFTAGAVGSGSIVAEGSPTITDATGTIIVVHGSPDHFRVSLPPTGTVGIGFSAIITAEDIANNLLPTFTDSIALSTSNGGIITPQTVTPSAGVWSGDITLTTAGEARVVRAERDSLSGQGTITLAAGPPATITLAPDGATVSAGSPIVYTALATDAFGNPVGDVSASTSFSIAPESGGAFVGNGVTPTAAGTWTVVGTYGGLSDMTTLTVLPGAPATLTLAPAAVVVSAGTAVAYSAVATDTYGNPIGDVTASTVFTITPGSGGIFVGNRVTPTIAGAWTVTGRNGNASNTASVTVNPGPASVLKLFPASVSIAAGTQLTYTAIAYDTFGNALGDVTASTLFAIAPASGGIFAGHTVTPTVVGTWIVTGATGGLSSTALVTVTIGPPSALTIAPATAVISAGVRITYTATATDTYGNSSDATASTVFSIAPASGGAFVGNAVTPTVKFTYRITGTHAGVSNTAVLTVTPAAYSQLSIEDAPAGTGTLITTVNLSLHSTLIAYAVGYDAYDNLIGPRTATWSGSGALSGTLSPKTGISTTLTPIQGGAGILTARSSGIADTAGPITILVPVLRISKSGSPNPVTPGAQLRYTIVYTNVGGAAAQNVVITETYPAAISYLIASPLPTSGANVWSIGDLPAGVTGTIVVFASVANELPVGAVLTNTVRIGAPQLAATIFTATTQVNSAPDVKVSKIDSADPVRVGDVLIYTIQYRNDGTAPATGVRITETYPSRMTYVTANPLPNIGNNVWLTNTLGGLGQFRFIYVTVRVNSPIPDLTALVNPVAIDTNETAPFTATQVTLVRAPVLALTKSAQPVAPAANGLLTYTLRHTNSGSTYASNVVVTDAVPANTTYQSCAPAGLCSQSGGIVMWNLGQAPSQSSGRLTMTVRVNNNLTNGTRLVNMARISAAESVSAFARITSTVSSAPSLSLSASDGASNAAAGNRLIYSLTYTNSGNSPAANVVITDRIPLYTTFQGCASACVAVGGGVYSFTLGVVNAGASAVVTLGVRLNSTLPAGLRAITNTARIQTATPGDPPSGNLDQDVDRISTAPALALRVDFDSRTPYPTKIVTYTVTYSNTSAMDTTGVVISVTKSPYVAYLSGGWSFAGGQTYTRAIGSLAAGVSGVVSYVVGLPFPYPPEMGAFVNRFVIYDNGPGGLPVATRASTATLGVPDLVVESVALSPAVVTAGVKFTTTIVIRNEGTGRACNPKAAGCGKFTVDVFVDPAEPPPSFSFSAYGDKDTVVGSLDPGMAATVVITNLRFTAGDSTILYFKVDNWDCNDGAQACLPASAQHGLVPESDENNNVFGPLNAANVLIHKVYAPVILKSR